MTNDKNNYKKKKIACLRMISTYSRYLLNRQKKLSSFERTLDMIFTKLFPYEISDLVISYQKSLFKTYSDYKLLRLTCDPCELVKLSPYLYILAENGVPTEICGICGHGLEFMQTDNFNIATKQTEILKSFEITDRFIYYLYERSLIVQQYNKKNDLFLQTILPDTIGRRNTSDCFKIDSDQIIYWTIIDKHQIYYINLSQGKKIERFGVAQGGNSPGEYYHPLGLAYDFNNLFICDQKNYRIQIINKKSGEYQYHFGDKGTNLGEFSNIVRVLVYEDILIIAQCYNLQFFNKFTGVFLYRIGNGELGVGPNPGEFFKITGLCVFEEKLFVIDKTSRIQVFTE